MKKIQVFERGNFMKTYQEMTREELTAELKGLNEEYDMYQRLNLSLNMARGKPCSDQLQLSAPMMDVLSSDANFYSRDGIDCRNYGDLTGIPGAKEFMAQIMDVRPKDVIIYGNSSLSVMFDTVARSYSAGVLGHTPWCKLDQPVKFLCPVPGYDRHFAILDYFNIEPIQVPMTEQGPDMDIVEKLVSEDEMIKGIWCVPKYANPTGISYSDETVRRFAALKPAAADFRIYWDNAYAVHHLYDDPQQQDQILNILKECREAGNDDMAYMFASTSKITFPGSGISALATSPNNRKQIEYQLSYQTIGPDKMNQLRHVRFLGNLDGVRAHMSKHAAIIRPKFECVLQKLEKEIAPLNIGTWTNPRGGYFIAFDSLPGCAKAIVAKCKDAGVTMTGAGATYPKKADPNDSNIRIAPTFPTLDELEQAMEVFVTSVKIISAQKLLDEMA